MTRPTAHPAEIRQLVAALRTQGVKLPDELDAADHQLGRVFDLLPTGGVSDATLLGRDDAYLVDLIHDIALAHLMRTEAPGIVSDVAAALAGDLADALAGIADDIIGQLRPRFDEAASVLHEATKIGITTVTTDRDVLRSENVTQMRDAWAAIPAASRTANAIAEVRLRLSTAAGAPPAPGRVYVGGLVREGQIARVLFHTEPRSWDEEGEEVWQKWIRLNTGEQARLLSTGESLTAYGKKAAA